MSAAPTPAKGIGGRKLKSWELPIQNPADIYSNMSDFLAHIENEPLGPGLATIANQLTQMYEANDNDARHFTHNLQKRFQKECDGYDTDTAKFIEDLALGLQTRIASLDKTMPIPEDWPRQMEDVGSFFVSSLLNYLIKETTDLSFFLIVAQQTALNFPTKTQAKETKSHRIPRKSRLGSEKEAHSSVCRSRKNALESILGNQEIYCELSSSSSHLPL